MTGPNATFVDRATLAFRDRLAELVDNYGLPAEEPEPLGERASLNAAAAAVWTSQVGPFLDTEGVSSILDGVSRQAISQRVRSGRMLALRTANDRLVYPLWQFRQGAVLPGLGRVLQAAGIDPERPASAWTLASWLATEDPDLGAAPRHLIAAGNVEPVLEAAADLRLELGVDELAEAIDEAA